MSEVEPKLILLRLDKHCLGGAQGGHVDGLARVDPPQVDRQLQLTKGHWWELPCGPQSIVVASFEGGFPLNGSAPSLVTKWPKMLFGSSTGSPSDSRMINFSDSYSFDQKFF